MASLQIIEGSRRVVRYDLDAHPSIFGWGADERFALAAGAAAHPAFGIQPGADGFFFGNLGADGTLRLNGRAANEGKLHHADILSVGAMSAIFCATAKEPLPLPLALDFEPQPAQIPWLQRFTWFMTRLGRARRALAKAFESLDNEERLERVRFAIKSLLRVKRQSVQVTRTIVDLLVFLCWRAMARGDLAEAAQWTDMLAREYPKAEQRIGLRWDLAKAAWQAGEMEGFAKWSMALVADKAAAPAEWADKAAELVGRAYAGISPEAALAVITAANPKLRAHPRLQAMRATCQCTGEYSSLDDAQNWEKQLNPDAMGAFVHMRADACLGLAAAAEWAEDWERMTRHTLDAMRVAPNHLPVLYWLCRARLHYPDGNPAEHLGSAWPEKQPRWGRLRLAFELHRRPSLKTAALLAAVLDRLARKEDGAEQKLIAELLSWALRGADYSQTEELTLVDRICRSVEARIGEQPWSQVHIARHEILVLRRHRDAYARLERKATAGEAGAAEWAAVARILAGDFPRAAASPSMPFKILQEAIDRVSGRTQARTPVSDLLDELRGDDALQRFPCLSAAIEVVALALQVLDGEPAASAKLPETIRPNDANEPWIRWLFARTLLLSKRGGRQSWTEIHLDAHDPSVAWAAELWAKLQRQSAASLADCMSAVTAPLDGWIATAPAERQTLDRLRRARIADYASEELLPPEAAPGSVFPELGERWNAACVADVRCEMEFGTARRLLADGKAKEVSAYLKKLDVRLAGAAGLVEMWWRAPVRYWLATAQARAGKPDAAQSFSSLLGGQLDSEARSQLALLALGEGLVKQAEQWLAEAEADLPAVRYARALVLARQGTPEPMRQQLDSSEGRTVLQGSPYEIPARRLLAATLERQGNDEEAERLRKELLATHPQDEITVARQSRRELQRAYERAKTCMQADESEEALDIVLAPQVRDVGWRQSHVLLRQLLTGDPKSLSKLDHEAIGREDGLSANWRRVLVNRLLAQGGAETAYELMAEINADSVPEWMWRTQAILEAWRRLAGCCATEGSQEAKPLAEWSERLRQVRNAQSDAALDFWQGLLGKALSMVANPNGEEQLCPWTEFDGQAFVNIPGLWSQDQEVRRQSAAALAADFEAGCVGFREEQLLLLKTLIAWATGADEAYLKSYAYLEPVLDELPVEGPPLWLAAGMIHFGRKNWRQILETDLPDCVADLAHGDVRLLIGLAYARLAADECVSGEIRNALKNVRRAQENLSPLTEGKPQAN